MYENSFKFDKINFSVYHTKYTFIFDYDAIFKNFVIYIELMIFIVFYENTRFISLKSKFHYNKNYRLINDNI